MKTSDNVLISSKQEEEEMKKAILFLIIGIIMVSLIGGCSKNPATQTASDVSKEGPDLNCFKWKHFIAGQTTDIGYIILDTRQTVIDTLTSEYFLFVEFRITVADWYLTETHVYFGDTAPKKNSPGKFPYKHMADEIGPNATRDIFLIPLPTDLEYFWFSAHAVVDGPGGSSETAWGENEFTFDKGWGWYCHIPNPVYSQ
jgi:hypothetical protein